MVGRVREFEKGNSLSMDFFPSTIDIFSIGHRTPEKQPSVILVSETKRAELVILGGMVGLFLFLRQDAPIDIFKNDKCRS